MKKIIQPRINIGDEIFTSTEDNPNKMYFEYYNYILYNSISNKYFILKAINYLIKLIKLKR